MLGECTRQDIAFKGDKTETFELILRPLRHDVNRVTFRGTNDHILAILTASDLIDRHSLTLKESKDLEESRECSVRNIKNSKHSLFRANKCNLAINTNINCSGVGKEGDARKLAEVCCLPDGSRLIFTDSNELCSVS